MYFIHLVYSCLFIFFFLQWLPIISFSPSLHLLHLFTFSNSLYKSLLPLSHFLTISPPSSSLISTSLSNPLISFSGTQVQEEFLHPLQRCLPSHPLEWSDKADDGSSLDLEIRTTSFKGCKGPNQWVFSFFSIFEFFLWFSVLICF